MRKNVFPRNIFNQENMGFSRMMRKRNKNESNVKNILYEVSTTYKLMGQLYGLMNGSPLISMRGRVCDNNSDEDDTDDDGDDVISGADGLSGNRLLTKRQREAKT